MKEIKPSFGEAGYLAARLFGFAEILILFGFQFFWIVYSGDLLYNKNMLDLLALFGPLVVGIIIGFLSLIEDLRVALRKVEWLIHFLCCMVILSIILLLQLRNEFNPTVPFSWLFHLW